MPGMLPAHLVAGRLWQHQQGQGGDVAVCRPRFARGQQVDQQQRLIMAGHLHLQCHGSAKHNVMSMS